MAAQKPRLFPIIESELSDAAACAKRLEDYQKKHGEIIRDDVSGSASSPKGLAHFAKVFFAGAVLTAGAVHAPEAQSAPHHTPSHMAIQKTAAKGSMDKIHNAHTQMSEAFGWKAMVDNGVTELLDPSMLNKAQTYMTNPEQINRHGIQLIQAASRAQVMAMDDAATPDQRAAAKSFTEAVINAAPSAPRAALLRSALESENNLRQARLTIRDAAGDANTPAHQEALKEAVTNYLSIQSKIMNMHQAIGQSPVGPGNDSGAEQIVQGAQIYAQKIGVRHEAAKKDAHDLLNDVPLDDEHLKTIAHNITHGDIGQRMAQTHEFLLAQRDSQGNILPGEVNLDAPAPDPTQLGAAPDDNDAPATRVRERQR